MIKERQTGTSKLKARWARRARVYVGLAGSVEVPSKSTLDFHNRVSRIFAAQSTLAGHIPPKIGSHRTGENRVRFGRLLAPDGGRVDGITSPLRVCVRTFTSLVPEGKGDKRRKGLSKVAARQHQRS